MPFDQLMIRGHEDTASSSGSSSQDSPGSDTTPGEFQAITITSTEAINTCSGKHGFEVVVAAHLEEQRDDFVAGPNPGVDVAPRARIFVESLQAYAGKMRGKGEKPAPVPHFVELVCSWVGAFLGILLVAGLNQLLTPSFNLPLLVASFGASAVLLFGMPDAKVSQPRNLVGGQVLSALVGCSVRLIFPEHLLWVCAPAGMATALLVMQLTQTVHPPGGASALIAASALNVPPWQGFQFVLTVFVGSIGMLLVALVINNIPHKRHYPTFWL